MLKDKIFNLACLVFVAVGSLGFIPNFLPFRIGEELVLEWATLSFIALFFFKNKWLKLFFLWALFRHATTITGVFAPNLKSASQQGFYVLFFYFVLIEVMIEKIKDASVKHILNAVCITALLQVGMIALQWMGIWWTIIPLAAQQAKEGMWVLGDTRFPIWICFNPEIHRGNLTGFTSNTTMSGQLLALCFPAFFRKGWVWWTPLVMVALLLTKCLGGIIPVILVASIWVMVKLKYSWKWYLPPVFGIFFLLAVGDKFWFDTFLDDGGGRWQVFWAYIKHIIPVHPVQGWGVNLTPFLSQSVSNLTKYKTVAYIHPHNEYLCWAAEAGVVGLALGIGYIIESFIRLSRKIGADNFRLIVILGFIVGLINMFVNFTLHVSQGLIFLIWMVLMEWYIRKTEESKKCVKSSRG